MSPSELHLCRVAILYALLHTAACDLQDAILADHLENVLARRAVLPIQSHSRLLVDRFARVTQDLGMGPADIDKLRLEFFGPDGAKPWRA